MKQFHRRFLLLLALCACGETPAFAEFSYGPFSFSAFGTLGGAWLSNQEVDYVQNVQPVGPGRTHDFDLGLDSRIGAQLNIALTPSTLVTAQTVVERLPDNEFQPRLTQANIRQEIGEHFAIRVGRIQSPVFLASDYRLANFSNPWVRTPGVVYGLDPLTHLDAVDLTWRQESGLGTVSFNTGYGWVHYPVAVTTSGTLDTATARADDFVYANLKLDKGPWRFKLSWVHARTTFHVPDVDQLAQNLSFLDPVAGRELEYVDEGGALYTAGFNYDGPEWLAMAEWAFARADHPTVFDDKHGGYLTVGYHLDRWLPHITLGYQATTDRRVHSDNTMVDAIIADVHRLQRTDYRTLALGLNYAVTDSIMLRGQLDLIEPLHDSTGPYFLQAGSRFNFRDPGVDALFSLSVDFVY